jgi:hypothetical protein
MKKKYLLISAIIIGLVVLHFYFKQEKVYTLKEYSPSGSLTGISDYVIRNGDTIFHGKFINYSEKGIKIAEGKFINNEPNGICSYYYDSGKIESVHYRKNSKITEESFFYNPNGLLEKYAIYDDFGKSSFIINFDEKGVQKYTGYPMLEVYQYRFTHQKQYNIKNKQILKVGDTLKYKYLIANIPTAKRTLKIQNISIGEAKVKRIITRKPPVGIDVAEIIIKKGINKIRAIVKYDFYDKITPALNDTVSFEIEVH